MKQGQTTFIFFILLFALCLLFIVKTSFINAPYKCIIQHAWVITIRDPTDTSKGFASMRDNLLRYGLSHAQPIMGVDARLLDSATKAKFPNVSLLGGIGCYLAHVKALRQAALIPNEHEPILIMEDDAIIHRPLDSLPDMKVYDIVFLGHCYEDINSASITNGFQKSVHPQCTHGYVVTPRSARQIVNLLKAPSGTTQFQSIDTELLSLIQQGKISSASANPARIFQKQGISTVGEVSGCKNGICYVNPDAYYK